ncbi:PfkB family carbohydrate kinase [Devosia sp.]|uniref:PfkB family carbohydrate kinase n=1 Tax=Devosia sp. TaxID=1871048 RepID=UPI003A942944
MFVVGGESLVDLVPTGDGDTRAAHAGGSPFNCAIALAKLSNPTGFLCPISTDDYGDQLLGPLQAAGVELLLKERVEVPTTKAIVTYNARREASYEFQRGADRAFSTEGLIDALPEQLELFQIGGFCPILPEDAEAWLSVAKDAAARGAVLTMDPNVRPSLVDDFAAYTARLNLFLDQVNLVKLSIEDLAALALGRAVKVEELAPAQIERIFNDATRDLLGRPQCKLVIVTFGEAGSRAVTRSGAATADVFEAVPFGDTVGAGDSLMAGVLTWLSDNGALSAEGLGALGDEALAKMLRFGAVVAGLNCRHVGCVPPTRAEVDAVLSAS